MLTKEMTNYLNEAIKEGYGSPKKLTKYLDKGIEMLFYIDEETFNKKEIQDVVSAIKQISDALKK